MRNLSSRAGVAVVVLAGGFIAIQFLRPELAAAPVRHDLEVRQPVRQILRNACYDCHSTDTRLLWFDRIVPAYWMVVADVKRGREKLDFSTFDEMPSVLQRAILFEAVNQIDYGAMPPESYRLLHPAARVTSEQISVLKAYLTESQPIPPAESTPRPQMLGGAAIRVEPEPNGIAFLPGYKGWTPISSTERFDNHTLRAILGNDAAIRAIDAGHTNPWPDGTVFAKAAWERAQDADGLIRPGNFVQVEFMIKEAKTYASTLGWGWARWKGTDLKPYGKSAAFARECTGCHRPMRDRDFVFTTPVNARGITPATPWKFVTMSVNPREATMSTLYGNEAAEGPAYSLVTWKQQAAARWFGARVPAQLQSVTKPEGPGLRPAVMP